MSTQEVNGRTLSTADEVAATLTPGGNQPKQLLMQLLATYFNLADRRVNAGTTIESPVATALGLSTVGDAVDYAAATLGLPVDRFTRDRYSAATWVLDEINTLWSVIF